MSEYRAVPDLSQAPETSGVRLRMLKTDSGGARLTRTKTRTSLSGMVVLLISYHHYKSYYV